MTVLQALAILEAAILESKKRDINTPEVSEALDFLEPHIYPKWLIPQFRNNLERTAQPHVEVAKEGQQQVLRATFPGIRDSVRELLGVRGRERVSNKALHWTGIPQFRQFLLLPCSNK